MYKLLLSKNTEKFLKKTYQSDRILFNTFIEAMDFISEDPFRGKALVGNLKGYYSYRVRDYRIIYEIENTMLHVYIEKIAHRKDSYK